MFRTTNHRRASIGSVPVEQAGSTWDRSGGGTHSLLGRDLCWTDHRQPGHVHARH